MLLWCTYERESCILQLNEHASLKIERRELKKHSMKIRYSAQFLIRSFYCAISGHPTLGEINAGLLSRKVDAIQRFVESFRARSIAGNACVFHRCNQTCIYILEINLWIDCDRKIQIHDFCILLRLRFIKICLRTKDAQPRLLLLQFFPSFILIRDKKITQLFLVIFTIFKFFQNIKFPNTRSIILFSS